MKETRGFSEDTSDPKSHATNIRRMLGEVADHARQDAGRVKEPKAQALFETTAEVLLGLAKACEHYASGAEKAMR